MNDKRRGQCAIGCFSLALIIAGDGVFGFLLPLQTWIQYNAVIVGTISVFMGVAILVALIADL